MDIDDKILHYLLLFGGMVVASTLHRVADALGFDTVRWIKKHFRSHK